jgi:hypothetical protein
VAVVVVMGMGNSRKQGAGFVYHIAHSMCLWHQGHQGSASVLCTSDCMDYERCSLLLLSDAQTRYYFYVL